MLVLSGKARFWPLPSSVPWGIKTYPFCAAFKEYGSLGVQLPELHLGLQKRMLSEQQGLRKISYLKKKTHTQSEGYVLFISSSCSLQFQFSSSNSLSPILSSFFVHLPYMYAFNNKLFSIKML